MAYRSRSTVNGAILCLCLFAISACSEGIDVDLRNSATGLDTSDAVRQVAEERPEPDERGIISYPNYQIVVARHAETVADVANRLEMDAEELARYNGLRPDTRLREGEIIALPRRVAEPSPETGADGFGPIRPADEIDIATLAGDALDRVEAESGTSGTVNVRAERLTGTEPIRHQVVRGETAYSIARKYKVSVRSLAEWNALGPELRVREGQFLIIPITSPPQRASASATAQTTAPGEGSPTPLPPSASTPLPEDEPEQVVENQGQATSPPAGERSAAAGTARLMMPVNGSIFRAYERGKNDGIDIAANGGTPVVAAADGTVAVITVDTDLGTIVVLRHADNLLTVYANVGDVLVESGGAVTRGQTIGKVGSDSGLHFEVREGVESVDPLTYLN